MPISDQDSRPLLLRGPSVGLRLAVLATAAVMLMVVDHRQDYLATARGWTSLAVYPLQWAVDAPSRAWRSLGDAFTSRASLMAENTILQSENVLLKLRLMRFESLEAENRRLRAARESSSRIVQRSLVAEILRVDLDPLRHRVLLNKGTRDGVFKGQAALDARGVFGQVTRVGPVSAELIMISDPGHAIPVQINRTGLRTIALGLGRADTLSLPFLARNADVAAGDLLVTSGLGGVFPPGYPVATVTTVERDPAATLLSVSATPLAELERDPEVLLVWFDNLIVEPETDEGAAASGPQAGTSDARPGIAVEPSAAAGTR